MSPIERMPDGSTWWVPEGMHGEGAGRLPEAQLGPFGQPDPEALPKEPEKEGGAE